jgi:hypothetical protein
VIGRARLVIPELPWINGDTAIEPGAIDVPAPAPERRSSLASARFPKP